MSTLTDPEFLPTRQSLLSRLRDWQDEESWRTFFNTYWRLIHSVAIRAGLDETMAQDVVQDTVLSVAKAMPDFVYDKKKGSFKAWLCTITRHRVTDAFRRRLRPADAAATLLEETGAIPIPGRPVEDGWDKLWDSEWRENITRMALDSVRRQVSMLHYQIFELTVIRGMDKRETARLLGTSMPVIYTVRLRVGAMFSRAVKRLEKEMT